MYKSDNERYNASQISEEIKNSKENANHKPAYIKGALNIRVYNTYPVREFAHNNTSAAQRNSPIKLITLY